MLQLVGVVVVLLAVIVIFVSCSSPEEKSPHMSNNEDEAMAAAKVTALSSNIPVQLGQSLQMRPNPGDPNFSTAAKDVVRWKGKSPSDIQPVRIYLGPWQPNPAIDSSAVGPFPTFDTYMKPTPWQTPEPFQFDAFAPTSLYAKVSFGGGGVQHVAYVDWPARGLLFQVSANYVQVDAQGIAGDGLTPVPVEQLPRLLAHISPEPGGGDSVQPATFTYPRIDFVPNTIGPVFQVPPFARACRPLIDQIDLINQDFILFVRGVTKPVGGVGVWQYVLNPFDYNGFNRSDIPLDGMTKDIILDASLFTGFPGVITPRSINNAGMIFMLDL